MISRPAMPFVGLALVAALGVSACGSAATPAPASAAASSGTASAEASSAGSSPGTSVASFALPSALASALASLGPVPDASTLVTADMAASIIGGSPTKVTPPINVPGVSIVSYGTASGDSVAVYIQAVPGGVANAQLQAAIAMAGTQGSLQPVSGVGDAAGKVVEANDATVAFVKGSALVVINARAAASTGADLEPKVEALAQQIAGKL